jgi:electron transport complex protein RnfA
MGVYLPLITTNCAVLGVCELVIGDMSSIIGSGATMNMGWAVLYAVFAGLGFTLVMLIMSGMREKINHLTLPKPLQGFPISMVTASFICMAFTVFSYIAS